MTNTSPWAYYLMYALIIPTDERASYLAELAALHLPDLTILPICSGCEVGRHGSPLAGTTIDAVALSALTHMGELSLIPGPQLTVDTSLASPDAMAAKVDAAIHQKLFRVLFLHMAEAAIQLEVTDMALARATCQHFGFPVNLLDDLVQTMGDALAAGCHAAAL